MLILIRMTQLCFSNSIWVTSQARQEHKIFSLSQSVTPKSHHLKRLISRAKPQRGPPLAKGVKKVCKDHRNPCLVTVSSSATLAMHGATPARLAVLGMCCDILGSGLILPGLSTHGTDRLPGQSESCCLHNRAL